MRNLKRQALLLVPIALLLGGCAPELPEQGQQPQGEQFESISRMKGDHCYRYTERLRVPGGWLYRSWIEPYGTYNITVAQTFVPDPAQAEATK
jgi:hypothetical protein